MKRIIVTIDGPAGSGKSTVAKLVAKRLGYKFLDSGALYRCVGVSVLERGGSLEDAAFCARTAAQIEIEFIPEAEGQRVICEGRDVTIEIRTPKASEAASKVSAIKGVRDALMQKQLEMGREGGLVAEGRDMGTVVFPQAQAKFFVDASVEERANRRFLELIQKGMKVELEEILAEQIERDKRDKERYIAPLKPAPDAFIIDTTGVPIEVVVDAICAVSALREHQ